MTVFFTLGLIFFEYLVYLKFILKNINYYVINVLILIIYALIISMIYYSPFENKGAELNSNLNNEHIVVATIAFLTNLILNIFVAYLLLYKKYKNYFIVLTILQIGFFLSLIADEAYAQYVKNKEPQNNYKDTYFPIGENINFFLF